MNVSIWSAKFGTSPSAVSAWTRTSALPLLTKATPIRNAGTKRPSSWPSSRRNSCTMRTGMAPHAPKGASHRNVDCVNNSGTTSRSNNSRSRQGGWAERRVNSSDAAGPQRSFPTAQGLAVHRTRHSQDPVEQGAGDPKPVEPQAAAFGGGGNLQP